jgi:hypothetical protein
MYIIVNDQDIFFISKIELIERRLIDKVKVDHPEENDQVTLLTNYNSSIH